MSDTACSGTVRPFAFHRDFAPGSSAGAISGDAARELADLRAELASLRAENRDAIAAARAEGYAAGLAEVREQQAAAVLSATDALHAVLEDIDQVAARLEQDLMRDAAEVALAAAEVIAGFAIEYDPAKAVDSALEKALAQVRRGTRLTVRVHGSLREEMQALVDTRQRHDRRQLEIEVLGDNTLAPGDGVIMWDDGSSGSVQGSSGTVIDAAQRRAALSEELGPLLHRA